MCGLAGFIGASSLSPEHLARRGEVLAETLAHRGPDDHGVWVDVDTGVVLAHRRSFPRGVACAITTSSTPAESARSCARVIEVDVPSSR